jgi:hypothetical protein
VIFPLLLGLGVAVFELPLAWKLRRRALLVALALRRLDL